jgi:hypothetical protein
MSKQYPINPTLSEKIENDHKYHAPSGDQPLRYDVLRDRFKALAFLVAALTPPSREQSLAFTHLEEGLFYANAAIARNEKE